MDKLAFSILILSIFWCFAVIFKKTKNRNVSLPPGPRGLPIVGYLPFLGTNLHREFTQLAYKYGPIFKLHLGSKLYVVLSSPSLVREVTREQDAVFPNRDPPIAATAVTFGGSDIAWATYGPYWRNMRKLFVREMMSGSNLDACYDLRKDEVTKAIEQLRTVVGTPVEIGELTFKTEMNLVMRMMWGRTLEERLQSKVGSDFKAVFDKIIDLILKPNLSDFFPILRRFDLQGVEKEAAALLQIVDEIFDLVLMAEDEVKVAGGKKDFIQILKELKKFEETGEDITNRQKKGILMDILVGGTDTSATITEWAMTEILHHSDVMEKVQKELDDVVELDQIVEEFHLSKVHYLEAVVKEAFRLHPPIPLVPRCSAQSSIVGGYSVPKDTRVFINAYAIQRDPELWDNPSEFNPERFRVEPEKWDYSGNNFQYIPFGSGRRVCAGIILTEKMLMYLLASLLHSFDWKPTKSKEEDLEEKFGIIMRKKTPLLAVPTKRGSRMHEY